eukprot:comp12103_c0_seq1/m.6837 comp12103_c0_seq1/g.6837  ORF comp12103_c0_seq1/g.6837 comp12103_c0_seq1/m.6837 type:complete len:340 (-) comp12103_c0_seq1:304-1323(-)
MNMGLLAVAGKQVTAAGNRTVHGAMCTLLGKDALRSYSTLPELSAEEQEEHRKKIEKLREMYAGNMYSHYNFPVSKFTVQLGKGVMGTPSPKLLYDGKRGLTHLTPWACAYFAYLGPDGDRGQVKKEDRESEENDQMKAHQELALSSYHLHSMEKENKELLNYFDWMTEVEGVLVQHVKDNIRRYPTLNREFLEQSTTKGGLSLEDFVPKKMHTSVKMQAPKEGSEGPYSFLKAKTKIYTPARSPPEHFAFMIDREMYTKHQVVRQEVGLFRLDGSSIPMIESDPIFRGDIVSAMIELNSYMTDSGFGLWRKLKNVTLGWENEARRKESKESEVTPSDA